MYKKIVRSTSLLLAVMLVMTTSAFAVDVRASSRIDRSSAKVRVGTDGNLWAYFSITASSTMDDIGASEIAIQRYNGSYWITESRIMPEDAPEMQACNASRHSASIIYTPQYSGCTYRIVVSVYATDGSGTSTTSNTSNEVLL